MVQIKDGAAGDALTLAHVPVREVSHDRLNRDRYWRTSRSCCSSGSCSASAYSALQSALR